MQSLLAAYGQCEQHRLFVSQQIFRRDPGSNLGPVGLNPIDPHKRYSNCCFFGTRNRFCVMKRNSFYPTILTIDACNHLYFKVLIIKFLYSFDTQNRFLCIEKKFIFISIELDDLDAISSRASCVGTFNVTK